YYRLRHLRALTPFPTRRSSDLKRNPKDWKGFKFAVPFNYSMHNYLLRYYVAEHGLDPDKDISIRSVPPPEMVANLRADNIDGYLDRKSTRLNSSHVSISYAVFC